MLWPSAVSQHPGCLQQGPWRCVSALSLPSADSDSGSVAIREASAVRLCPLPPHTVLGLLVASLGQAAVGARLSPGLFISCVHSC